MSRKKKIWLASAIFAVLIGVILGHGPVKKQFHPMPHEKKTAGTKKVTLYPLLQSKSPSSMKGITRPWDDYQPLTIQERHEFAEVEAQVHKFLSWGKMDPEAIPAFRQTLFRMGDRAVADLARELSQITRDNLQDRAAAEEVIHKIDVLAYFADSSNPLAADAIAAMARRPVKWNEAGELLNPVEANITFEMFDMFAKTRPHEAVAQIRFIEKKHRPAYFTRYAYGRKLAGKTMEEIDLELRAVFGSPELALK